MIILGIPIMYVSNKYQKRKFNFYMYIIFFLESPIIENGILYKG